MTFTPPGPDKIPPRDFEKAALRGEPSYVWRAGQQRRLEMILNAAQERIHGWVLENGCGVGMYVDHLAPLSGRIIGLEYDPERARQAQVQTTRHPNTGVICAAGEELPFPDASIDLILSHEVLEHVRNDRLAANEMVRVLKPSGRVVVFAPNRGYPFETHGIYWRGEYFFGNIPFVNYLPNRWRNRLAPHVRVYSARSLADLFAGLPVRILHKSIIFGAYDNIIARWPLAGKVLRSLLQFLEKTPFKFFGLSHFWVIEKKAAASSNLSQGGAEIVDPVLARPSSFTSKTA